MATPDERVGRLEGINEEIRNRLTGMDNRMNSIENRLNVQIQLTMVMLITTILAVLAVLAILTVVIIKN